MRIIKSCFILLFILSGTSNLYSKKISFSLTDVDSTNHINKSIILDMGAYPFRVSYSGDFEPHFVCRFGYGYDFLKISVHAFFEYTYHQYNFGDSMSRIPLKSGDRKDYAIYLSSTVFKLFSLGLGVYVQSTDQVIERDRFNQFQYILVNSESRLHFYYLLGLSKSVRLYRAYFIVPGIFFRNQSYSSDSLPYSLRLGMKIIF